MKFNPELGGMLEKNSDAVPGKNILVTSGCRSAAQNAAVGGASNSSHTRGDAVDSNTEDRQCESYKKAAEQANGRTFITCNHGTAPHLHMDVNSPPCKNCGKEKPEDFKRQDQQADPKQNQAQQGGGGSPGGGSPGGGSPQGGGSPEGGPPATSPTPDPQDMPRRADNTPEAIDQAMEQPPNRLAAAGNSPVSVGERNKEKSSPEVPLSSITKDRTEIAAPALGRDPASTDGSSRPSDNLKAAAAKAAGGGGESIGGSLGVPSEASATSTASSASINSYSGGGGYRSSGGSSSSSATPEVLSPFTNPLGDPKIALAGSETESFAREFANGIVAGAEEAEELDGEIGERNGTPLFERCHNYYMRCVQKGCLTGFGVKGGGR